MKYLPAFRRQFIVAFAALTGCLILAGLAAALVSEQREERRFAELRFQDEAAVAAALTHAIFKSMSVQSATNLTRRYGDAVVERATLDRHVAERKLRYVAVLDERGRLLRASSSVPPAVVAGVRRKPRHVRAVLRGATFEMSNIVEHSKTPTMEYATSFPTRHGRRLVVNGFDPKVISGLISGYLAQIPNHQFTDSYLLEGTGLPLASALRGNVAERPSIEPALKAALAHGDREFTPPGRKPQVFTSAPVRNTPWRVVSVTDRHRLYASVAGSARVLPWTIFGVLAAAVLAGLLLLARFVRNAGALARANLSLADSNTQLAHDALHDMLTGLPNRNLFRDRLQHALQRARRAPDRVCAVVFLDVDHFKLINDSLGHEKGDHVLVALAQRLQTLVRPGDTVARLSGDEFTVLLEDIEGASAAAATVDRITAGLADPLTVGGREYFVTMSAGIAIGTAGSDPEDLIRDADTAMYRAKSNGRACHALFDPRMREQVVHRAGLQNGLRQALHRGDIKVAYQPIFDLASGELAALEALARWQTLDGQSVPPAEFIAVAEESGLIGALGRHVLATACESLVDWRARGIIGPDVKLTANVSSRQFVSEGLITDVTRILAETGLPGEALRIELTESAFMLDPAGARAALDQLRELGVRFLIDDFGTGYSSLAQLSELAFEMIKIDRSFVARLEDSGDDGEIVRAIVGLAHNLGRRVIAEGVETDEQAQRLRRLDVDLGQGYLFAKPLEPRAVEALFGGGRPALTAA